MPGPRQVVGIRMCFHHFYQRLAIRAALSYYEKMQVRRGSSQLTKGHKQHCVPFQGQETTHAPDNESANGQAPLPFSRLRDPLPLAVHTVRCHFDSSPEIQCPPANGRAIRRKVINDFGIYETTSDTSGAVTLSGPAPAIDYVRHGDKPRPTDQGG